MIVEVIDLSTLAARALKQFSYVPDLSACFEIMTTQFDVAAISHSRYTRQKFIESWNALFGLLVCDPDAIRSWQSYEELCDNLDLTLGSSCPRTYRLSSRDIDWDAVAATADHVDTIESFTGSTSSIATTSGCTAASDDTLSSDLTATADTLSSHVEAALNTPTDKSTLYLQPPQYILLERTEHLAKSPLRLIRPATPRCQRDISAVTDVNAVADADLLRLFPSQFIQTRNPRLYDKVDGLDYVYGLGVLVPVDGFSREQIIDNIIRYPHLYNLKRQAGPTTWINFYSGIELNGELRHVSEVWDSLPEAAVIPRENAFIREYVIRRYLLERDAGMYHKYELWGSLDPFLTLIADPSQYLAWGYSDPLDLAKRCVAARVNYKQSRNPALRGMDMPDCVFREYCTDTTCDKACARHAQFNYLLELNKLTLSNTACAISQNQLAETISVLHKLNSTVSCYTLGAGKLFTSTVQAAQAFAYTAICDRWEGSACNAAVYTINYSDYLQATKDSWSKTSEPESLRYAKIWIQSARLLIIYGLDYVKFGDFECQTLLQLLQQREAHQRPTLLILPGRYVPSGSSYFLTDLIRMIKEATLK